MMGYTCRDQWQRVSRLAVGFYMLWPGGSVVEAGNLYVYTDGQGQTVLTDSVQQVPAEYRGRLRTVTGGEPPAAETIASGTDSAVGPSPPPAGVIQEFLHLLAQKVPPIKGLSAHHTAVVIVAGASIVALLSLLFLSANPAIRILAKCLLILVSLAALYQLAVGGPVTGAASQASGHGMDNLTGLVKTKTQQSYRLQDERTTRQLDQAEPPTQ